MRLKGTQMIAWMILAIILLIAPRLGYAGEFKLNKAIGVGGVTSEEVESFTELVRLSIARDGVDVLSDTATTVVQPRIIKIGSSYLVAVEKLQDGKIVFTDSVRVSGDDEWEPAARRLARSVVALTKDSSADLVVESPSPEAPKDLISRNRLVLGFGPFFSHGLGSSSEALFEWYVGMNFEFRQLAPRLFLTGATGVGSSGVQSFNIGLGVAYYLSVKSISPYLGFDFSYGSVRKVLDEKFNGFSIAPFFGYAFLRDANVALTTQVVWRPLLAWINGGFGGVYGLEMGLQF